MSKCVGLNQFRHRALIQLKDGGLAHLARFHPDFSLFRSRQGISDENKGDFFLFAQVADARTAFGLEHYKAFFFKNCFPHIRKGRVPGRNQNNGLIFSQVSVSSGECINIVHVNIGRLMLQLRRRLIYARKSLRSCWSSRADLPPKHILKFMVLFNSGQNIKSRTFLKTI